MPKISVIIPVYNVKAYLHQCVDSVLHQTMDDIQIILIDDGSTDGCSNICDEYAAEYSQVITIHQKNGGIGKARNTGMKRATGKYIFFLDSDDWIETFACETMFLKAEKTEADLVLTGEILYSDNKRKYSKGFRDFSKKEGMENFTNNNFIHYFTPAWGRLYRKSFLTNHNLNFVENCFYEDNSWGCFMLLWANKIAFVKNCVFSGNEKVL